MARRIGTSLAAVALLMLLCLGASAESATDHATVILPTEYGQMLSNLPEALRESLPDEVFTTDAQGAAKAWEALATPEGMLHLVFGQLTSHVPQYLRILVRLCGLLLLRAVYDSLAQHARSGAVSRGVGLLVRVVTYSLIVEEAVAMLSGVQAFYDDLQALGSGFLPLMGAMYAMGGNVAAAVVNHSTLILTFSIVQWLGGRTVIPLFSLCLSFCLLGAFQTDVAAKMRLLTGKLKKWYTTALSLAMLLLSATLAAQTTLGTRADSMGFRTVRFAVSSSVPILGGGIAEMLRTASAGLSWLRGTVGLGGVVLLLWLLLPQLLSLWLARSAWSLAGDVACFLGCSEEAGLLGEVSSLYGYLMAVVALSVMTFFFALLLLFRCGVAYA